MAEEARRNVRYSSYGNVAYDPAYIPQREREEEPGQERVIRRRERVESRTRVQVRAAGYVSPVAVVGFALVVLVAVGILGYLANIAAVSGDVVSLKNQSAQLQEEHRQLLSEYELAFDLKTVEEIATQQGGMIQPQPGQQITLDLSEPDSAYIYAQDKDPLGDLWGRMKETTGNILAFFR